MGWRQLVDIGWSIPREGHAVNSRPASGGMQDLTATLNALKTRYGLVWGHSEGASRGEQRRGSEGMTQLTEIYVLKLCHLMTNEN
jgi:hypothetical protein